VFIRILEIFQDDGGVIDVGVVGGGGVGGGGDTYCRCGDGS
jgi:hypothetical protein